MWSSRRRDRVNLLWTHLIALAHIRNWHIPTRRLAILTAPNPIADVVVNNVHSLRYAPNVLSADRSRGRRHGLRNKKADRSHTIQVRVPHHANMHVIVGAWLSRERRRNHSSADPGRHAERSIGQGFDALDRCTVDVVTTLARIPVMRGCAGHHQRRGNERRCHH